MKVYYFNDENEEVTVHVNSLKGEGTILKPANGMTFEIDLPNNDIDYIPFIKRWYYGIVLITYIEEDFNE